MTQIQPVQQLNKPAQLVIHSRALAAFAGIHLQQRPLPVLRKNRVSWAFQTAMTVGQLKLLYRVSPALPFLELHADLGADISKTLK